MRATLKVLEGDRVKLRQTLRPGSALEVGRSPDVDMALEHDTWMSARHFMVKHDGAGCYLYDLNSTNGTMVNGKREKRVLLHNLDTIVAGHTHFQVEFLPDTESPSNGLTVVPQMLEFRLETCRSGVFRHSAGVEPLPPSSLNQRLEPRFSRLLVLDLNKLPAAHRPAIAQPQFLMNWLPPEAAVQSSPTLIGSGAGFSAEATDEVKKLERSYAVFDEAWGKDALVAVYYETGVEPPLENLRRNAGLFARPSVLRPQLTLAAAEFAGQVLQGIEAVLVEGDPAETWELYSLCDLSSLLAESGMVKAD